MASGRKERIAAATMWGSTSDRARLGPDCYASQLALNPTQIDPTRGSSASKKSPKN